MLKGPSDDDDPFALVKQDPNQPQGGLIGAVIRGIPEASHAIGHLKNQLVYAVDSRVPLLQEIDEAACNLGSKPYDPDACKVIAEARPKGKSR